MRWVHRGVNGWCRAGLLSSRLLWVEALDPEEQDQHELWFVPIQYWGMRGALVGAYQVIVYFLP